jgi:excisionase family DNA binding protein
MNVKLENCADVLTVREVASLLRINKDAAYALVGSGILHHFRCGRSIRIPKIAVLRFLGEEQSDSRGDAGKIRAAAMDRDKSSEISE